MNLLDLITVRDSARRLHADCPLPWRCTQDLDAVMDGLKEQADGITQCVGVWRDESWKPTPEWLLEQAVRLAEWHKTLTRLVEVAKTHNEELSKQADRHAHGIEHLPL